MHNPSITLREREKEGSLEAIGGTPYSRLVGRSGPLLGQHQNLKSAKEPCGMEGAGGPPNHPVVERVDGNDDVIRYTPNYIIQIMYN